MTHAHCHPGPWGHIFFSGRGHGFGPPPPPPPWILELLGGGRRRAERGEVRFLILDAIKDEPRHGYDIIQSIETRTHGAYKPSPGTVYPTLQLLEEMGHCRSSDLDGRKVYEITAEGRAELERHSDEVEEAYERLDQDGAWLDADDLHQMAHRVRRMMRSVGRGFRRGRVGSRELRQIGKVLEKAMAEVEAIIKDKR
jgi:DNA-binding PadR family transcriptional regulator